MSESTQERRDYYTIIIPHALTSLLLGIRVLIGFLFSLTARCLIAQWERTNCIHDHTSSINTAIGTAIFWPICTQWANQPLDCSILLIAIVGSMHLSWSFGDRRVQSTSAAPLVKSLPLWLKRVNPGSSLKHAPTQPFLVTRLFGHSQNNLDLTRGHNKF